MLETFNKMVEPVNSLIWSNPIVFLGQQSGLPSECISCRSEI